MDRQRRHLIILAAAFSCCVTVAFAQEPVTLREAGWLAEEGRLNAVSSEPAFDRERLLEVALASPLAAQYGSPQALKRDLLAGEILFKTPLLLGGQAAKAGISCHSCHVNGRDNPHFEFPAISGEPGTADTTHNFFSETLSNGVFDPVPIPDLARKGKVDHSIQSRDLERFIETIVVEEFSGGEQKAVFVQPIATFVRALALSGPSAGDARRARSAVRDWADTQMIVDQSKHWAANGNAKLADILLSGARDRLFVIHERLIPESHGEAREWLIAQSRALGRAQTALGRERVASDRAAAFADWEQGMASAPDFALIELDSLYNPDILAATLEP